MQATECDEYDAFHVRRRHLIKHLTDSQVPGASAE